MIIWHYKHHQNQRYLSKNNLSNNVFIYFFYRKEKETLAKIGKMLQESSIVQRHRRIMLGIHTTFLAWVTEFLGFFTIFLGTFLLGHENNIVNFSLQTLTIVVYFNLLPCIFLLSTPEFKDWAVGSSYYGTFLLLFNWHFKKDSNNEEDHNNALAEGDANEEANAVGVDDQQPANSNDQPVESVVDIEEDGINE